MKAVSLQGRLTNETHYQSMENAYKAGFAACAKLHDVVVNDCPDLSEVDLWSFDPRPAKADVGRPAKKQSPKPADGKELSEKEYDPSLCRARYWNQGWGAQCWRLPCDGETECKQCLERFSDDSKDNWGYYDEPLEDAPLKNSTGKAHPWKKFRAEKAAKKESEKAEKAAKKESEKAEQQEKKQKEKEEKKQALLKKKEEKKKKKAEKKAKAEAEKKAKAEAEKKAKAEAEKEAKAEAEKKAKAEAEKKAKAEAEEKAKAEAEEKAEVEAEEKANVEVDEVSGSDSLDEDTDSVDGDDEQFVEYVHDGYTMKWNKVTNELRDPDDDALLGRMEMNDEGEWKAALDGESDSESDDDSDSDSDDEE